MTLVAQDFYLHHQLFEYIPRDVQGLNLDFILAIDRIRQSYIVGSVDGLDAKITFLESDDFLSCDEFLIPSLVSPLLDESKVDPVALRKLLSAFGKYPSVEKKASRLLARLQA